MAGKYVFVDEWRTWPQAQLHCRTHFTELAFFSFNQDRDEIHKEVKEKPVYYFWVGVYREETAGASWRWSGGGNASNLPWVRGHPSSLGHQAQLCMKCATGAYGLHAPTYHGLRRFLCLNLVVVATERRTWEEALEYCRERHDDLASLAPETDLLVASRKTREAQTTERVWVGLRHLGSSWMWLKGAPLGNKASLRMGLQGQPCSTCATQQCYTCGSLSHSGELQGVDCKTQLNFLCY